jgi:hypothetical protein
MSLTHTSLDVGAERRPLLGYYGGGEHGERSIDSAPSGDDAGGGGGGGGEGGEGPRSSGRSFHSSGERESLDPPVRPSRRRRRKSLHYRANHGGCCAMSMFPLTIACVFLVLVMVGICCLVPGWADLLDVARVMVRCVRARHRPPHRTRRLRSCVRARPPAAAAPPDVC